MQNWRWSRGIRRRAGWVLSLLLLLGVPWAQAQELLVGSISTNQVLRYDGQTGAFRDAFVAAGSGGLVGPQGLVFGPDGALYVSSVGTAQVLRYDGQTGAFRDAFVAAGSGGLQFPGGLVFRESLGEPGPAPVNDLLTFDPIDSSFQTTAGTTGCPAGFLGEFRFEARLTNISESAVADLIVQVNSLTHGNLLQNSDGGPAGVGALLTVPPQDGFADGLLNPGEVVDVPFVICLQEVEPFTFMVDVLGVVQPVIESREGGEAW